MRARLLAIPLLAGAGVLAWGELMHWRASRRRLGTGRMPGPEAVVVLGFGNRDGRANLVNRYRVRAGIRSLDGPESVLVLCGGAVAGRTPEADVMARYARDELGHTGPLLLERGSRTTEENIRNAIPLIETAGTIKIVSDSLHAEKGRAYLWMLRPDLAARFARGRDYRFGELILLKPIAAVMGLVGLRRLSRPAF
nr:YdcF family protein [Microbacterium bovistercoris]